MTTTPKSTSEINFNNVKFKNPKRTLEKELHIFSHQKKKN